MAQPRTSYWPREQAQFSYRAQVGRLISRRAVATLNRRHGEREEHRAPTPSSAPIAIIGAGAAGLCAAMMLQDLNVANDIVIFEANPDRIGGRMYTYEFSTTPYDYYDVGAMRYPNIPWMKPVFDMFSKVDVPIIPYIMNAENNVLYFNGQYWRASDSQGGKGDIFHVTESNGGVVSDKYINDVPPTEDSPDGYWFDLALEKLREPFSKLNDDVYGSPEFIKDFADAWDNLMQQDYYSTREFFMSKANPAGAFPEPVVEWLETMQSSSGLFDEALSETVIDSLDFGWPQPQRMIAAGHRARAHKGLPVDYQWYCIDGGTSVLGHKMVNYLVAPGRKAPKFVTGARVTDIVVRDEDKGTGQMYITYVQNGQVAEVGPYSQVICTAPLGCTQAINKDTLLLSYQKKAAIRSLQYDAATKIGIKFPTRWWETLPAPIVGGVSSTDLPIRTVVYPSYDLKNGQPVPGAPGILLASYTWAQDARRLGAISTGLQGGSAGKIDLHDPFVQLTLDNLAQLHKVSRAQMGTPTAAFSFGWFNDPLSRGAFALFGPGEFAQDESPGGQGLFASVKAPNVYGTFHIAGEATSVHHAWVVGAFNSAWRAVFNVLKTQGDQGRMLKLPTLYPTPEEEDVDVLSHLHRHALKGRL